MSDSLNALAKTIKIAHTGPSSVAPGDIVQLGLDPVRFDFTVPSFIDGKLALTFLAKQVRFLDQLLPAGDLTDYLSNATKVIGGQPVEQVQVDLPGPPLKGAIPEGMEIGAVIAQTGVSPPTVTLGGATVPPATTSQVGSIGAVPPLAPGTTSATDLLSGVPGILGGLRGTVPIPAQLPISVSAHWTIKKNGNAVADNATADSGILVIGGLTQLQLSLAFLPSFVELLSTPGVDSYEIAAEVTLTAGGDTATVTTPSLVLTVPQVGIPRVAAFFKWQNFIAKGDPADPDAGVFLLVPTNSLIQSAGSLQQALNALKSVLTSVAALPFPPSPPPALDAAKTAVSLLLTGVSLLQVRIATQGPRLAFRNLDSVGDLSAIPWGSGIGNNPDDDVRAVMFIGMPGQNVKLCENDNLSPHCATLTAGTAMFISLPDLDNFTVFAPPDQTVPTWMNSTMATDPGTKLANQGVESVGFV